MSSIQTTQFYIHLWEYFNMDKPKHAMSKKLKIALVTGGIVATLGLGYNLESYLICSDILRYKPNLTRERLEYEYECFIYNPNIASEMLKGFELGFSGNSISDVINDVINPVKAKEILKQKMEILHESGEKMGEALSESHNLEELSKGTSKFDRKAVNFFIKITAPGRTLKYFHHCKEKNKIISV